MILISCSTITLVRIRFVLLITIYDGVFFTSFFTEFSVHKKNCKKLAPRCFPKMETHKIYKAEHRWSKKK